VLYLSFSVALAWGQSVTIGYTNCLAVTNYSQATMTQISQMRWYFAHASVGELMMEGVTNLHAANPNYYLLQGPFATNVPPSGPTNGLIYQDDRGDTNSTDGSYTADWPWKIKYFQTAVSNGWHYPFVNFAMNKPCYIDIWHTTNAAGADAALNAYLASMTNLEAAFPQTCFIYCTMPLVDTNYSNGNETQPFTLYLRNLYNNSLRAWCATNGRVLYDLADIESHDTNGNPVTFVYSNLVCQQLFPGYSHTTNCNPVWANPEEEETGDDAHPVDYRAEKMLASGFYALAAALLPETASAAVTSSANPSVYGQAVSFAATVSGSNGVPTGTVQFLTNGVNWGVAVALSNGVAASAAISTLPAGSNAVSAAYSGDRIFIACTGALAGAQSVLPATLTVTGITANNKVYDATNVASLSGTPALAGVQNGDPLQVGGTPTARFASSSPGTNITVTVTGYAVSGTNATNYVLAEPTLAASIMRASTTNVLASSSDPSAWGSAATLVSTPSPVAPGAGVPTGTVRFLLNGVATESAVALSNGAASLATSAFNLGTNVVVAQYPGDSNFLGSTGNLSQLTLQWTGTAELLGIDGGRARIECAGTPYLGCELQRATNLDGPWVTLVTSNAPASGVFQWLDTFSDLGAVPATAFYRLQRL
jgi:hypothetical protein